jgi:transcriptional regulator with XRE-family HTH domain
MPARPAPLLTTQEQLLLELGERLRNARLRRKLTASAVAAGAGVSRVTVHRAERGEPAIATGTLIKIMGVLDLAGDFALLARDDRMGRLLQDSQLRPRRTSAAAAARPPQRIRIDRYPQLQQIAWHLGPSTTELGPEEAFALYERNWRHVDRGAMDAKEAALLKRLTATIGKGVLLV